MADLRPKLDQRLRDHVENIDLQNLCRIDAQRLSVKAIPNIGRIELASGTDFANDYDHLYIASFPHHLERERSDLVVQRLKQEFAGLRDDLAPYRIVGIRDHDNKAIGAAQFSVLKLLDTSYAVPYLQYIYIRAENRRQDMAEVLHTMVLAVASADAAKWNRVVPFTLFECEPSGYGTDEKTQSNSTQRVLIHAKAGAVAVMLEKKVGTVLRTPHVQPGLEIGDEPLTLLWAIRPAPFSQLQFDIRVVGYSLLKAYYQSLRDEGFPESNIALAEDIVHQRCQGFEFITMPLADVLPDVEEYVPA